MNLLNRLFAKLNYWISIYNIHIIKTLYFNFRMLPFRKAIHLPFVFYGKTEFSLQGKVEIKTPCHFGMAKIGKKRDGFAPLSSPTRIDITKEGKLLIKGDIVTSPGCTFRIIGTLELADQSFIGSQCIIACNNHISIGYNSRISFNSVIVDTNFHYISIDDIIYAKEGNIHIGDNCWIGNSSSIMKGAYIPNGSIVAARSLINKNFSQEGENIMLAGIPAKVKRKGVKRIFSPILEAQIYKYFTEHPDEKTYRLTSSK